MGFFQKIYRSWDGIQSKKYGEIIKVVGNDFFNGKILDIGCGSCRFEDFIMRKKNDACVIGLDVNKEAIAECKSGLPLVLGDGNSLPFEDNAFDVIISLDTMHKINQRDFSRVLKYGGHVLFSIFFNPINKEERQAMLRSMLVDFDIMKEFEIPGKEDEFVIVGKKI